MTSIRVRGVSLAVLIWLLSWGVASAQQDAAPMVITFPAPATLGLDDDRPAAEVLGGGIFVFAGGVFCAEVDLTVADRVEVGVAGQPEPCRTAGAPLTFIDFASGSHRFFQPPFESGAMLPFAGYELIPSGEFLPQSVCDFLDSRGIEPAYPCGRLGAPELIPSTGSCATPFVLATTSLTPGDRVQLSVRRVDRGDSGRLVGEHAMVPPRGEIELPVPASVLADICAAGGEYEVAFVFGDPPVVESKSVLFTVAPVPLPAEAGNAGFVPDNNVGRTTAVIGLVVVTVAVVAARLLTNVGSPSRGGGRER